MLPKEVFKKVNGYSNSYWGWGFEDTDMRNRLLKNNIEIKYRNGIYQPLIHDNLGYDVGENNNFSLSKYHIDNKKIFDEKWQDKNNFLQDGINNFKFEVDSDVEIYKNNRFNSIFEIRHIKVNF